MGSKDILSAPLTPVERALRESLQPPDFRDVRFYAFSRRTVFPSGSIQIDHPLPIVAIGSILKDTEHFSKLLTSGFAETNRDSRSVIRQRADSGEYDYDSDSDLDEFEEVEDPRPPAAGPSSATSSKGKLKDDVESLEISTSEELPASDGKDLESHQILVPNMAYRTLRACVFYLYTGKINFLPLVSEGQTERKFALLTTSDSFSPPCSPKSIYRLAESYGITELQDRAFDEIVSRLTPNNIVEEAFSSFFARYDRLREHAVSYLSQHYNLRAIQASLPDIIDRIVLGELPHAGGVLRSLLGLRVAVSVPLAPAGTPGASSTPKAPAPAGDARRPGVISHLDSEPSDAQQGLFADFLKPPSWSARVAPDAQPGPFADSLKHPVAPPRATALAVSPMWSFKPHSKPTVSTVVGRGHGEVSEGKSADQEFSDAGEPRKSDSSVGLLPVATAPTTVSEEERMKKGRQREKMRAQRKLKHEKMEQREFDREEASRRNG